MKTINLKLFIEPKPLRRARHSSRNGFVSTYYKREDKQEMDNLKYAIINALNNGDRLVVEEYLKMPKNDIKIALEIEFGFSLKQSYSKKKKSLLLNNAHTLKPDLDNLVKNILDRGNGILWSDDDCIYKMGISKMWSEYDYISLRIDYDLIYYLC